MFHCTIIEAEPVPRGEARRSTVDRASLADPRSQAADPSCRTRHVGSRASHRKRTRQRASSLAPSGPDWGEMDATEAAGLTTETARRCLIEVGPNEIAREKERGAWAMLAAQFSSPLVWLLLGASLVSGFLRDLWALADRGLAEARALADCSPVSEGGWSDGRQADARPLGMEVVTHVSDELPIGRVIGGFQPDHMGRDARDMLLRVSQEAQLVRDGPTSKISSAPASARTTSSKKRDSSCG
jgi:hypothetical protein